MAPLLRSRLSKSSSPQPPEHNAPIGDTAPEVLTNDPSTDKSNTPLPSEAVDSVRSTPPPPPPPPPKPLKGRLGSRVQSQRSGSPSQSLLDRYKKNAPITKVTADTAHKTKADPPQQTASKRTAFTEAFDAGASPAAVNRNDEPHTPAPPAPNAKVELVGAELATPNKQPAADSSSRAADTNGSAAQRKRLTRSLSKKEAKPETSTEVPVKPRPLTIRKVHNFDTDSPSRSAKADLGDLVYSLAGLDLTAKGSAPVKATKDDVVEQGKGNEQKSSDSVPDPSNSRSPTPSSTALKPSTTPEDEPTIPILPPPSTNHGSAGYVWTSALPSTSRPSEPWGWVKRWTCCQCAARDPNSRGAPVQTIVEQKTCARLICGHERCLEGCRLVRDARFNAPGVFAR